jgi:hypothetical protein
MRTSFQKALALVVIVTLLLAMVLSFVPQSRAAAEPGISVTPFMTELQLEPGVAQQKTITVTNATDTTVSLAVTTTDFAPSDNGQPRFPSGSVTVPDTYSLTSWVNIISDISFTLAPGATRDVVFTVTPPVLVEPGTRYGAILFTTAPQQVTAGSRVVQTLASLLVARYGQGFTHGYVSEFDTKYLYTDVAPITYTARFVNDGNVHLRPKGEVVVTNMFGREVAREFVNRDAGIVLPNSDRVFSATWVPHRAFGWYTAELRLLYGDERLETVRSVSFWVLPVGWVVVSLVGLIILGFGLVMLLRRYSRWIISRHRNS